MSIVKLNNRGVKNATAFGSITGLGDLVFISRSTASSSSSVSITSGIDSTYKEYIFIFNNIHPATNLQGFLFNGSIDSGSNYNVTKTTTTPRAYHDEADSEAAIEYDTGQDLAQSTSFQGISRFLGNGNDEWGSGTLHIFDPSSTTFVKHFIAVANTYYSGDYSFNDFTAGYGNTTSAVNAVQFKMSSGNIHAGTIKMYGIKDS